MILSNPFSSFYNRKIVLSYEIRTNKPTSRFRLNFELNIINKVHQSVNSISKILFVMLLSVNPTDTVNTLTIS